MRFFSNKRFTVLFYWNVIFERINISKWLSNEIVGHVIFKVKIVRDSKSKSGSEWCNFCTRSGTVYSIKSLAARWKSISCPRHIGWHATAVVELYVTIIFYPGFSVWNEVTYRCSYKICFWDLVDLQTNLNTSLFP